MKKRKIKLILILTALIILIIFVAGGALYLSQKNNADESSVASEAESSLSDKESSQIVDESSSEIDSSSEVESSQEDSSDSDKEAINAFKSVSYYNDEYLERYLSYQEQNTDMPYEQVILKVNIGLDNPFYTNTYLAENYDSTVVLVNKYSYLPNDYQPADLVAISAEHSAGYQQMRKEAAEAFEKMCVDASEKGYTIKAQSTFRSYSSQYSIYNNYVSRDGAEKANTYSAQPGHSEHQTGLAVDVQGSQYDYNRFGETKENQYVLENAYKFGFIVRYTAETTSITGYMPEPWHLRYVGVQIATVIHNENITFDEYCAKYMV